MSFSKHQRKSISITSQSNLLVLHPDILLTATALSSASQCRRKPLLSSLVHSSSDTTPALVWGSMLHEVIQKCLLEQRWDQTFIQRCVDEAVVAGLGDLVKVGLNEDVAQRELQDRATGLKIFQEKYLHNAPKVLDLSFFPNNPKLTLLHRITQSLRTQGLCLFRNLPSSR